MIRNILKLTLSFVLLLLTQIFVLSKISIFGFITPMIYIVFILSLSFKSSRQAVIILGFLMGMIVDIFQGDIGIHALATLVIAFIRPAVIYIIPSHTKSGEQLRPTLADMKFKWYIQYVLLLTLIHHSIYYLIDVFSFDNIGQSIVAILVNTGFSVVCIFIIQMFFYRRSKQY